MRLRRTVHHTIPDEQHWETQHVIFIGRRTALNRALLQLALTLSSLRPLHRNRRASECVCVTLRHMNRRRSAASLPSYRAVPTRERTEATYRDIIAAAVHAFRVRGYADTTMSTVAAIAGVSPRTLYRYFGSKSELFTATVEDANAKFLQQLTDQIHASPLREAIVSALKNTNIELNDESREMMRLAAADEIAWRYFLGAASHTEPKLAAALRASAGESGDDPSAADEDWLWDVRASALLGAIAAAYRRWATIPGSDLSGLAATAVDVVLPAIGSADKPLPKPEPSRQIPK